MGKLSELFKWCFLSYLAVLPMSGTIALRNLLLLVLVCIVITGIVFLQKPSKSVLSNGVRFVPWILILWGLYLLFFPLFAVQPEVAWQNLKGQWIESILAWVVGFGAVMILGASGPGLWSMALASAVPLIVHLSLCLVGWAGLLGDAYQSLDTLGAVWRAFVQQFHSGFGAFGIWREFPLVFRGVEPMHGNLGYAASQAIALFAVIFLVSWRERQQGKMYLAAFAIVLCFLSILIARSRGAVLFGVLVLLATAAVYRFKWRLAPATDVKMPESGWASAKWTMGVVGALCLLGIVAYQSIKNDSRWHSMADKVQIGFAIEKPMDILCDGVPEPLELEIRRSLTGRSPEYIEDVLDGLKGQDGGRILLMRAGLELVLENPRGLDGARQSFQKLMEQKCGHVPRLHFAHSHQSWIDLSLALGWAGVLLFAGVMVYFMREGWRSMKNPRVSVWATPLFLLAAFWVARGMVDAVYREHYLQMQAVLLAYLYGRMRLSQKAAEAEKG